MPQVIPVASRSLKVFSLFALLLLLASASWLPGIPNRALAATLSLVLPLLGLAAVLDLYRLALRWRSAR